GQGLGRREDRFRGSRLCRPERSVAGRRDGRHRSVCPMTQNVPTPRVAGTILVLAFAAVPLAVAEAQTQPAPAPRTPPSVVDVNPCPLASHWHLRCPDLRMKRPFGV